VASDCRILKNLMHSTIAPISVKSQLAGHSCRKTPACGGIRLFVCRSHCRRPAPGSRAHVCPSSAIRNYSRGGWNCGHRVTGARHCAVVQVFVKWRLSYISNGNKGDLKSCKASDPAHLPGLSIEGPAIILSFETELAAFGELLGESSGGRRQSPVPYH
jgi:hypothetical protein